MPPRMLLVIGALVVLWIVLRIWLARAERRRQEAHDERMAALLAEREALLLAKGRTHGVDVHVAPTEQPPASIKVRCRTCRGLSNENATHCSECGEEL